MHIAVQTSIVSHNCKSKYKEVITYLSFEASFTSFSYTSLI